MKEINVRIVTLPPMRIICFNGFGPSPEGEAFTKAINWAKSKGIWNDGKKQRFFGYNNPDPSPGSLNYGYDVWMTVDKDIAAEGDARIIEFPGGLYAVTRVHAGPKGEGIYDTWQVLAAWVEKSKYTPEFCSRQWLEESLTIYTPSKDGSFTLDLYEPIRE